MTEGKTFAEMPRRIPKLDVEGKPILGEDGKPAMTANTARDIWITATTLIAALNLGIFAYVFFAIVLFTRSLFRLDWCNFYALGQNTRNAFLKVCVFEWRRASFYWHEIREGGKRGAGKIPSPPTPSLFCPPERFGFYRRLDAASFGFRSKRFELGVQ